MTEVENRPGDSGSLPAGEVAELLNGRLEGDATTRLKGVAPLNQAGAEEIGFLAHRSYLRHLPDTGAGALLVSEALADQAEGHPCRIVVDDPHRALPVLLDRFYPTPIPEPGIHSTAVLGKGVELGKGVTIGPYAVLESGAVIGDRVRIGAHSVVGAGATIGADSLVHPHVVLYPGTRLGDRVIIHSGARLGVDGFGYVPGEGGIVKIPQVGACVVKDDVEVGANTCVDRGSIGQTVLGRFTKLDNLVQVGHNVRVGKGVMMASMAGVSGSTEIGDGVMIGGQAGIGGHLTLGAGAKIGAQGGVIGDIPPGKTVSGYPARDHRDYLRGMGMVLKLPDTAKRLKSLEERLAALEEERGE